MHIQWEDLRYFLAAWRSASLSGAARELGVSQPTMSRRIAALEDTIGHALFDRVKAGLVATTAAERIHPFAEAMEASAAELSASLSGFEVAPEGLVKIAVPPGLAVDLLPIWLPELKRRYPKLRIEILSDNLSRDLHRHEADIALRSSVPESGDLLVQKLADIRLGVFASPDYIAALPPHAQLKDVEFISWSSDFAHIPMAHWVTAHAARPPVMTSNSFLALRAAAEQGIGAVVVPEIQAIVSKLVRVPVKTPPLPIAPFYMVVHRALRRVPRVAVLVDFIVEGVKIALESETWPPS